MLTPEDPFAAIDIDHVRDPITGTIENWAQRFLDKTNHSYAEISPSGTGLRIWGTASGETLHRKFTLDGSALELFRRTRKPLTVTGLQLGNSQTLGNIDALLDRAVIWAQQRQHKQSKSKLDVNAGTTGQYSIDQIEQIVREGAPDGANRSDTFHGIVGHYIGCGWAIEQIIAHLEKFPDGMQDAVQHDLQGPRLKKIGRGFSDDRQESETQGPGVRPEQALPGFQGVTFGDSAAKARHLSRESRDISSITDSKSWTEPVWVRFLTSETQQKRTCTLPEKGGRAFYA